MAIFESNDMSQEHGSSKATHTYLVTHKETWKSNANLETSQVVWHSGHDTLKDCRFGRKKLDHNICPKCGSSVLNDSRDP